MARIKNVAVKGLRGMIGDTLVYRTVNGKTVVSAAPDDTPRVATEKQTAHRERFKLASFYASRAMANPELKAAYEAVAKSRGTSSGRSVAVSDFFHAPKIDSVVLDGFSGQPGEEIPMYVTDDFRVNTVHVEIYNPDGTEAEHGDAVFLETGRYWVYTTTGSVSELTGSRVVVKATDLPGNETSEEFTL